MLAETTLSKSDLIQPIFIKESLKGTEEIKSMPGINRLGLDILDGEIEKIIDLGIKSIAVFPVIDEDKKDEIGSQATEENNFICQAISSIKKNFPDLVVIADVALDPYTDHGHDGLLDASEVNMIEIILIIVFFAMIGLATLNWQLCQAIITENERQRQERTYLSEQRENKLNENR